MDDRSQVKLNDTEKTEYTQQPVPKKKSAKPKSVMHIPIITIVFMIAISAIFVGQTYAYFTDTSSSTSNRIAAGSVGVSLIEVNDNGSFNWDAYPIKIMPASVYTYGGVGAKNTGTLPVYVRIKVEKTLLYSEHEISPGWEDHIRCNFMANDASLPEDMQDMWVYHEGYYYYKVALEAGEETTSLFDKVLFDPEMGNEFKNSTIQFKLVCQSVQAGGNSSDPVTAWGWPADGGLS